MGVSSKCYEQYAAHQQMNALQLWRQNCENRVIWGRLKSRFAPVLTYWYRRVKPNMRLYLHRWRLKVLLMRKGLETINKSDAFARLNPSLMLTHMDSENMSHQALIMQEALSKLSINQRYGGLVGDVNDGLSQLQNATWIVSNYLGKLSKKTVEVETVSKSNKKDIQLNRDKIEKVHTDMSNMIRSRFEVSEKALVAYK